MVDTESRQCYGNAKNISWKSEVAAASAARVYGGRGTKIDIWSLAKKIMIFNWWPCNYTSTPSMPLVNGKMDARQWRIYAVYWIKDAFSCTTSSNCYFAHGTSTGPFSKVSLLYNSPFTRLPFTLAAFGHLITCTYLQFFVENCENPKKTLRKYEQQTAFLIKS